MNKLYKARKGLKKSVENNVYAHQNIVAYMFRFWLIFTCFVFIQIFFILKNYLYETVVYYC